MTLNNDYSRPEVVDFWTKTSPRTLGDVIDRPRAIEELGDVRNQNVLDAGCATGYNSRKLARKGAHVIGIDSSIEMIERAKETSPSTIKYVHADISTFAVYTDPSLPTTPTIGFFQKILCTGVLLHNPMSVNEQFFKNVYNLLDQFGLLVVSVPHPSLILPNSPTRDDSSFCVKYELLENKLPSESQHYIEKYSDFSGNTTRVQLWNHPVESYLNAATQSGLKLIRMNEIILEKKHLKISGGTEYGFPVFLQLVLQNQDLMREFPEHRWRDKK